MLKILAGVFVGAFVGTLAYEIVKRKKPRLLGDVYDSAQNAARTFADAFEEGYSSAASKKG